MSGPDIPPTFEGNPNPMLQTIKAISRLEGKPGFDAANRTYLGRKLIGHDTPIQGGVSVGANPREAIVVDDAREKDSVMSFFGYQVFKNPYDRAYKKMKGNINIARINALDGNRQEEANDFLALASQAAYVTARDILGRKWGERSDVEERMVRRFVEHHEWQNDGMVNLSEFMSEGIGTCIHKALLAGYLLERMVQEVPELKGAKVSVDRNRNRQKTDAHAWVRMEMGGKVYIIDPQKQYVGTLEKAPEYSIWDYRRPDDTV